MKNEINLPKLIGKGYGGFWKSKHRYRVIKGGRGSKKSKTAALYYIYQLMKHPQANLLVIRRNFRTLKDSCYSDLLWAVSRLGVENLWKGTANPLELTYIPTGQKVLFRGLDDGLKITSISVPKGVLCWVWFEEAYEITKEEDFDKVDMSIRGEIPPRLWKQITLTFNPWSANSWLKRRFFDDDDNELIYAATTTYQCNEWLDAGDLKLFAEMQKNNPRRYRIEGLGEWGISEGLIYEKVRYEDFDIEGLKRSGKMVAAFGLDFGFTDPTALVCTLVDNEQKTLYVFDEWYQVGTTNAEIAAQIIKMGYGSQRIICDSAEPKSIAELQQLGIKRAEASRKGADSVLHGIQLLQNYTFVVHTKCRDFYKEISNYSWAKDKFGRPIDKPEHEFSHGMDAVRYGVAKAVLADRFSWN